MCPNVFCKITPPGLSEPTQHIGKAARHLVARARYTSPGEVKRERLEISPDVLAHANASSGCLSELDSKGLLKACGIAVPAEHLAPGRRRPCPRGAIPT